VTDTYRVVVDANTVAPRTFPDRTAALAFCEELRAMGVENRARVQVRAIDGSWWDAGEPEERR
jgi:hypothetical protein